MGKVCNTLYGVAITNSDFFEVTAKIAFNPGQVREIISLYEDGYYKVFVFKLKKDWEVVDYFSLHSGEICRDGVENFGVEKNIVPALKTLWRNATKDEMCYFFGE